jgi:hypothetical protein
VLLGFIRSQGQSWIEFNDIKEIIASLQTMLILFALAAERDFS